MSDSFFIGGFGDVHSNQGNVRISGDEVIVDFPLDLYIDENNNVYAGRTDNNAIIVYLNENEIYTRRMI